MPFNTFQIELLLREMGHAGPSFFISLPNAKLQRETHVGTCEGRCTDKVNIILFYTYFLKASFEARQDTLPKRRS